MPPFLPSLTGCSPSPPLPQVLLLEAYEQLELDCAKEIDKALAKEREERGNVERKVQFLQVSGRRGMVQWGCWSSGP